MMTGRLRFVSEVSEKRLKKQLEMMPKNVTRFSEKIMLNQRPKAR